ncbi:hypothetical protein [Corynebacterium variabile]|uniref:hypothetical protein n=1 Tax=Corynebacterium variabile TaxID=1727 RepID=UPI00264714C9|nr:hypothetical protein [Corynebacterium variabile]MDN6478188.1 hypothetical protein [Corynebacterium variabile]
MDFDENGQSVLFLSCDLTGSTRYKQSQILKLQKPSAEKDANPWQKAFLQFYHEFPQILSDERGSLKSKYASCPDFELWKPVGDELIFSCVVRSELQIRDAIRVWIAAMDKYETSCLDDTPALGTKGGAFVATFPEPDSRSSIPKNMNAPGSKRDADVLIINKEAVAQADEKNYLFDYFGPSIDTGFRITSKCSDRYFTLSVEAALGLLQAETDPKDVELIGMELLKGVWNGREYPLVAIDRQSKDSVNIHLRPFRQAQNAQSLKSLCYACYGSDGWPSKLFLPESDDLNYREELTDPLKSSYLASESKDGAEDLPEEVEVPRDGVADNFPTSRPSSS